MSKANAVEGSCLDCEVHSIDARSLHSALRASVGTTVNVRLPSLVVADRSLAQGKALERAQDDTIAVIERILAGLGEIVVAQILGRNMDGDQVPGGAHARHIVTRHGFSTTPTPDL